MNYTTPVGYIFYWLDHWLKIEGHENASILIIWLRDEIMFT